MEVDGRNEKIGKKIREAQLEKVPYMLVVGDRDMEAGTVSVRHRAEGGAVLFPVLAHVLQLEALWHLHIQLDGAALPGPPQAVGEVEVQLGCGTSPATGTTTRTTCTPPSSTERTTLSSP